MGGCSMKKYKNATISINRAAVRDIALKTTSSVICNVCGEEISNNPYGYLDNYISIKKKWEYGTKFDGERHSIDICACCYEKFLDSLKIPAKTE